MQLKTFALNSGGTTAGLAERIEVEGNKLLAEHPKMDIKNVFVIPTSSGLSIIGLLYTEVVGKTEPVDTNDTK